MPCAKCGGGAPEHLTNSDGECRLCEIGVTCMSLSFKRAMRYPTNHHLLDGQRRCSRCSRLFPLMGLPFHPDYWNHKYLVRGMGTLVCTQCTIKEVVKPYVKRTDPDAEAQRIMAAVRRLVGTHGH